MLLGLRTAIYKVDDLAKATAYYTKVVGHAPYFNEPFYVGFNVGGYELGLIPDGDDGISYWGTNDINAEFARMRALGATVYFDVKDVGDGVRVGALRDVCGNVFGLIENPHFKLEGAG